MVEVDRRPVLGDSSLNESEVIRQSGHLTIRELERIRDNNLVDILLALEGNSWGAGEMVADLRSKLPGASTLQAVRTRGSSLQLIELYLLGLAALPITNFCCVTVIVNIEQLHGKRETTIVPLTFSASTFLAFAVPPTIGASSIT